ncbi:SUMF1/EgtB/PvdO family nonheme iron enzyme [Nitrosomonas ureae]|uniref:Formylglycine-generating enzyme, required for sulfatase activity, contains SUMF1/FGE domain n=1 Tax=Nitrosomonas ureae TaxID=44577 RepID=A0A1H9EIU6_9PROT|nr:SUMF1/EgtB/PvdO family nonheme iron enzyme [Nitrosomonas ureae]SEQ25163.1 Formylglycine-generating enzyme, required for sulfatase activity, contains SUMF1/FGE domain [Nitrosomonas ureae]
MKEKKEIVIGAAISATITAIVTNAFNSIFDINKLLSLSTEEILHLLRNIILTIILLTPIFLWCYRIYKQAIIKDNQEAIELSKEKERKRIENENKKEWESIKKTYRDNICKKWKEKWPKSYSPPQWKEGTSKDKYQKELDEYFKILNLNISDRELYIEDQGLELLVQKDPQKPDYEYILKALNPKAFVLGRDTEQEAKNDIGKWKPQDRGNFFNEITQSLKRVFVISGGGIGKSTFLEWLRFKLSSEDPATLAFLFVKEDFQDDKINELEINYKINGLETIINLLVKKIDPLSDKAELIKSWIKSEKDAGRIVLLIDGLDHFQKQNKMSSWLIELQSAWHNCSIVLSGRPYVVNSKTWSSRRSNNQMFVGNWQFYRLKEFTENQQKAYLGVTNSRDQEQSIVFRRDLVPEGERGMLGIPRVLEYLLELTPEQFSKIDSVTKVFDSALSNLVTKSLNENEKLKKLGQYPSQFDLNQTDQTKYVLAILGVLAFLMTQQRRSDEQNQEDWNFNSLEISPDVLTQATERIKRHFSDKLGIDQSKICSDIRDGLIQFSSVMTNGILESIITSPDSPDNIYYLFWTSKSVQCYFTAYWLACYADETDAKFFEHWVWSPESVIDDLRDINLFLVEMPEKKILPVSWVNSAAAWFKAEQELSRPAEMMFRAWPRLLAYADEDDWDWWNTSYHKMQDRTKQSSTYPNSYNPKTKELAKNIIKEFRNELTGILKDTSTDREKIAKEFISESSWKRVPEGHFKMGYPEDEQGFPRQTLEFWHETLDLVRNGEDIEQLAKRLNPEDWFTGFQGEILRKIDVEWLKGVFSDYKNNIVHEGEPTARTKAIKEIEDRWRKVDETPLQNPQHVASFEMHQFPVLHRWFRLFSPKHEDAVKKFLDEARKRSKDSESRVEPPGDDHPVIYINWFEAWAFCQWAQWEHEGKTYRCRLPHEPEWEFAAHGVKDPRPNQFLPDYWWGNDYYIEDISTEDKYPIPDLQHTSKAHTYKIPGGTRSPSTAECNEFGFYDILGNVWEWMANVYDPKYSRYSPDPDAEKKISITEPRAMRGGVWYFLDLLSRCSHRFRLSPDDRDYKMGFRVIREEIEDSTKKSSKSTSN